MTAPDPFPLPAGAEDIAFFSALLEDFAASIRAVDYDSARPRWHPRVLAFGTHMAVIEGLEDFIAQQWHAIWPTIDDFRFLLPECRFLVSAGRSMASVVAPWISTGYHEDGRPYPRPGRATLVFAMTKDGWKVIHSHMSLGRGVPTPSHKKKPVGKRGG